MLNGKNAVVTGGTRGIGAEICKRLAEKGVNIAFLYSGREDLASAQEETLGALGVKAKGYKCNVASFDEVKTTVKEITKEFGKIQILVNNAGITRDNLLMFMKEKDFDDVIDINLKGAYNTIKHLYPVFVKQRYGKIINISSVTGLMGNEGQVNYAASKAGLIGLTKSVARELASLGVCCNAVAPGFIDTEMTKDLGENNPMIDKIPMKRLGTAEEISKLVLFLASEDSDYITGEVIRIDGGLAR